MHLHHQHPNPMSPVWVMSHRLMQMHRAVAWLRRRTPGGTIRVW
jgi:hypothetical protein